MVVPTCHKNGVLWKPFRDSAWSVILFWQLYTHTETHLVHRDISIRSRVTVTSYIGPNSREGP